MSLPDNSKPTGNRDLAQSVDRLSARDRAVREEAMRELFALGLARVRQRVSDWLADPEVAGCFVFDEHGAQPRFPRATVGIAVEPAMFAQIRGANGAPGLADVPPDLDAEEFEIRAGENVRLDILTTRDPEADGAIARFLRKHGKAIQQVELSVHNVDRATHLLGDHFGLAPVYPRARKGADGTRVNFFLIAAGEGKLLIELVEESRLRT